MGFPARLAETGTPLIALHLFNARRGLYGDGNVEELANRNMNILLKQEKHVYDRELDDGTIVQIHGNFTEEGWLVTTYTDVTAIRSAEKEQQSQTKKIRQAEHELSQRNKTLEAITENTNHGISLFDNHLELVACNARFLELMEFPTEFGKPGTNMKEYFCFNARRGEYGTGNFDKQVAERVALAKKFEAHKFERVRPNGTVLEIIGTPISEGFVTTYTDITELRNTQTKLEEATENLQVKVDEQTHELREKQERSLQLIAAFDALNESVAVLDANDNFVFSNRQYQQINKDVADKLVPGTSFEDYITAAAYSGLMPIAVGQEKAWLEHRMNEHRNPTGPFESLRHTGTWLLVHEQKLEQGGSIMFATDITERKLAEEALRASEELLRATAENLPEVFWISNVAGVKEYTMEYVNSAFEKIWQRKREEVYENASIWFHCIHPDDKDRVTAAADDFYHERRPYSEEFRIIPPDGVEKTIHVTGNLIKDSDGKIVRAAGIARDVTDRKNMEEQVRRSQKMDAVGQLTGGIAHDFNNILGIIQGNLELLESLVAEDKTAQKRVDMALKGVSRGIDITKNLLGFSRKDAQQVIETSLNSYVHNLKNLVAKSLTASIHVETHLNKDLWPVAIDPGDFEDVLLNLSLNARDAMPKGGTLIIETSNKTLSKEFVYKNPGFEEGDYVLISVSDTGEGMLADLREKIFEPFFTTKEQGKGTGLGLSMVYGFVKRSGGYIKVHSEEGQGTTFRIYLPRSTDQASEQQPDNKQISHLPRGTETILVVDDEKGLRDVAAAHLEGLGYCILEAQNSEEALNILKTNGTVDLLFSDIVMPGLLDGYQLAVKAHEQHPELDILLTSGFTKAQENMMQSDNEYLRNVIKKMMNKPYSQKDLAVSVRKVLDATF